jgi:hypothetical protein
MRLVKSALMWFILHTKHSCENSSWGMGLSHQSLSMSQPISASGHEALELHPIPGVVWPGTGHQQGWVRRYRSRIEGTAVLHNMVPSFIAKLSCLCWKTVETGLYLGVGTGQVRVVKDHRKGSLSEPHYIQLHHLLYTVISEQFPHPLKTWTTKVNLLSTVSEFIHLSNLFFLPIWHAKGKGIFLVICRLKSGRLVLI